MDWRHVCYEINNVVYGAALRLRAAGGWMAAPHPHGLVVEDYCAEISWIWGD